MRTESKFSGHIPAWDGVRGVAITMVMVGHFFEKFKGTGPIERAMYWISQTGWSGVDLFFVLSGFLITRNLLEAKGQPHFFRNFYARRVLRIFPLYYFSVALFLFALPVGDRAWMDAQLNFYREHQWYLWLHASNWLSFFTGDFGLLYHYWSLAVEEQFYLLWPAVIFFTPKHRVPLLCAACVGIGALSRGIGLANGLTTHELHLMLPARLGTLAIGGFLATLDLSQRDRWVKQFAPWVAAGVGSIALSFVLERYLPAATTYRHLFYFTALALGFAYFILWVTRPQSKAPLQRLVESRLLRKLGKHSYALYIFHTVIRHFMPFTPADFLSAFHYPLLAGALYTATLIAVSLGVSILTWELIEKRFLALKRHFLPAPPAVTEEAPPRQRAVS